MKDRKTKDDVSPYLLRPLRTVAQAAADLSRYDEAVTAACHRNQRGTLIAFPQRRRRNLNWQCTILRGLRRPA
tara:strand:+ start:138 stop:356 length:219 start_codon:yes stop_codon:yes gene_type:complete